MATSLPCSMRVVGTGALGAYYGWRLHCAGCRVVCVCRSNYAVVKQAGFQIDSCCYGEHTFKPWQVTDSVENAATLVPDGYDYVIVCTKALPEVASTADVIAPAMKHRRTAAVLIQNGIGIEEPVAARFPHNPCISAVAYIGVTQIATGVIRQVLKASILLGVYNRADQPVQTSASDVAQLAELFGAGGIGADTSDDIQPVRWNKLIWNAGFGLPSVLTRLHDTQSMLGDATCRELIEAIMQEIWDTALKLFGPARFPVKRPPCTIDGHISMTEKVPAYKPSIYVDYEAGRPMELEVIVGNTIREARRHQLDMPRLETLYKLARIASHRP
ncbi:ketopantoate reductase PanE/ApbA-domain-containing protein [Syncephalis pseudoplumigaleata]|uniref:2-dehydropantoate 2-reductase n=1 Tax=Syncephalis pseudoplumigaleata TaxID=1712513 RepID=A0A4P9YVJ9_9FUNG|nr:ketopantoate reductase PanE/ApbA-domain-containing protein [Syncephalis pseudoplumigaleata]|eukprot:RKP23442.1 ketopantoate reductase PanE/ApbA-domain-containing protein [Syncephalis pseudoplumigaleata]